MSENEQLPVILVADDSADDRLLMERVLRKAGVNNPLVFAGSGDEAISVLQHSSSAPEGSPGQKPAVVFLDVNMPPGDGFRVLKWIREEKAFLKTRVVMMTDSDKPDDLKRAESLKADGYLLKHPHPQTIAFLMRQAMAATSSEPRAV